MAVIYQLTIRNIKLFVRDKMALFFSMLNPLIIFCLYFLFIRAINLTSLEGVLAESGVEYLPGALNFFLDSWMITGVISVTSITLPLGIYSIMVEDRSKNIHKDFIASPVKSYKITVSYILAVVTLSVGIILLIALASFAYMYMSTGNTLSFGGILSVLGVSVVSCMCSAFLFIIPAHFIKSLGAFSGLNAILGVVLGFLTGAYMPLSVFPSPMQTFAAFLPGTHVTAILRNIFMSRSLPLLLQKTTGETYTLVAEGLREGFGAKLNFFGGTLSFEAMLIFLFATTTIFLTTALLMLRKKS